MKTAVKHTLLIILTFLAFLSSDAQTYTAQSIPYTPYSYTAGAPRPFVGDDLWSDTIFIGFPFYYYGQYYNKVLVGDNGEVSFNLSNAMHFNAWRMPVAWPDSMSADMYNTISPSFKDWYPQVHGKISYGTFGTAPNRYFIASWDSVPSFRCYGDSSYSSFQTVLYEGSNAIDFYLRTAYNCSSWNYGHGYCGLMNATGNDYTVVAGRNGTQWTANNEGWHFGTLTTAPPYLNQPPLASDDLDSININTAINLNVRGNDRDPERDSLSMPAVVVPPVHGTVTMSGTATYSPDLNFTGVDSFLYQVCDTNTYYQPHPLCDSAWVAIYVHPVHAGPDQIRCVGLTATMAAWESGTWSAAASNPATVTFSDTSSTSAVASGFSQAGTYLLVWSASAGRDTVEVTIAALPVANAGRDTIICAYDSIVVGGHPTMNGGTGHYAYAWHMGPYSLNQNIANPRVVSVNSWPYYLMVTDSVTGCAVRDTVKVAAQYPASIYLANSVNPSCYNSSDGGIYVGHQGSALTYTYSWSPALSAHDTLSGIGAGTYCVTMTDSLGCHSSRCFTLTSPTALTASAVVTNISAAGAADGSIYLNISGGTFPYQYAWTPAVSGTYNPMQLSSGIYIVTVTDAHGCELTDTFSINQRDSVWPGDADRNRIVNNNDLLPIGLGYDSTGPARQSVAIVWQPYDALDWAQSFTFIQPSMNYKHADCNGDGTIDADDTMAVHQNYGRVHAKTDGPAQWRAGQPLLYPILSRDTVHDGDTLLIDIALGDASLIASNVYGLAFTVNYDAAVIDTLRTSMSFANSWLSGVGDHISIYRDQTAAGMIQAAVTRIDHTTRSGSGVIAQVRTRITTAQINSVTQPYYPVQVSISGTTAIDQYGHAIMLNEGTDSSVISIVRSGLHDDVADANIDIYPTPASSLLHITSTSATVVAAEVINALGEVVSAYTWPDMRSEHTADISHISSGVYYIRLYTHTGMLVKKISVVH